MNTIIIPAGGRVFMFELTGLSISPDSIKYKELNLNFECDQLVCRFSIPGSPGEPAEGQASPIVYSSGDAILVFFDQRRYDVIPKKKEANPVDRY